MLHQVDARTKRTQALSDTVISVVNVCLPSPAMVDWRHYWHETESSVHEYCCAQPRVTTWSATRDDMRERLNKARPSVAACARLDQGYT